MNNSKNYISFTNAYYEVESEEYPGLDMPVSYLRSILFFNP